MPEESPKQLKIEDPRVNSTVTYTQTSMKIERRVNNMLYGCMMILGLLCIAAIFVLQPAGKYIFFILPAAFLVLASISEASYSCDIDKEKRKILRKRSGILGTRFGARAYSFSLDEVKCLRINQRLNRNYDTFGLKLVLTNGTQLDMPSETSLKECMEYANLYRDFLEISASIELPA